LWIAPAIQYYIKPHGEQKIIIQQLNATVTLNLKPNAWAYTHEGCAEYVAHKFNNNKNERGDNLLSATQKVADHHLSHEWPWLAPS
jgi:hypothetical protein